MSKLLLLLTITLILQSPYPIPPDDGGCHIIVIDGQMCVICKGIIQC